MHDSHSRRRISRTFTTGLAMAFTLGLAAQGDPALAGTEIHLTTTVTQQDESRVADGVIKAQDGHLWMDMGMGSGEAGGQSASIYRADHDHLTVIDHGSRSYSVMDEKAIGQIVDEMMSAMMKIDQQMGGLPVEQRKVLQDAWKADRQRQSQPTRVVNTGEVSAVSGFSTRKFDVFRGQEKIREVWVANWNRLPDDGASARDAMVGLEDFFLNMKAAFDSVSFASLGGARPFEIGDSPFQNLKEMKGFPVRTRAYRDGELISETLVTKVVEVDVPAETFEPPKDYRQRTMDRE